jgi:RimJ/RimL family protein N-acetyltransferase
MPENGASWLTTAPPALVEVDLGARLTRPVRADVGPWVTAVNESREHLEPWMPWARTPASLTSMGTYLRQVDEHWESRDEFGYLIRPPEGDAVIGGCGLHTRRGQPGALEIGYWVHVAHTGRGLATATARALTAVALDMDAVDSVVIRVDAANERSLGVPRRLGFRLDRTERRRPEAPGEAGELMIWVHGRD